MKKNYDGKREITKENMILVMGLIAGVFLMVYAYFPVTQMSFCLADDIWMLLNNPYAHPGHYSTEYFSKVFTRINDIQYSPLNTVVYSLIYKINSYDPYYFHLFNLLMHLGNSLLAMLLAKKILEAFDIDNALLIAYLVFLMWGLHPMNVEPVTWVSGSKILICTMLTLLSFYFLLDGYLRSQSISYVWGILFFLLSCFVKEQGIITPFMFAAFVWCLQRKRGEKVAWRSRSSWIIYSMIAFSLIFGIFTMYTVNRLQTSLYEPMTSYPFYQRFFLCFYCLRFYVIGFLAPVGLHYHYPFPIAPGDPMPMMYYLFPLFFIPFCVLIFILLKKNRDFYFYVLCLGIFFMQIFLELQIMPMTRPAIVADRYMYFPSIGLLLVVLHLGLNKGYQLLQNKKARNVCVALFSIYIIYFITYSNQLVSNWTAMSIIK